MAETTRNVTMTKTAYVKQESPNTVFPTNSSTNYLISSSPSTATKLFFGGGSWPDSLKYNKIVGATITVYVKQGYHSLDLDGCDGSFDTATVTWNNQPERSGATASLSGSYSETSTWQTMQSSGFSASSAVKLINGGGFCLVASSLTDNPAWYARTVLSGGGAVSILVTYDDSVKNVSKIVLKHYPYSAQDPRNDINFEWILDSATNYYSVSREWTQTNATLYWRYSGESSWNQIAASGSTMSAAIPAYTLQTGKTVEFYISATDNEGTTSNTSTLSFQTLSTQITAQNAPTSGYKNPRTATTFGWYFQMGTYHAESGNVTLYWRETGASSWTSVSTTSGSESVTVAANTFPVGSSVEWYLSGTDFSGVSSQTAVYTFSTSAGTAYSNCVSPISSVEDGSSPITFTWTLSSTDGQTPSGVDFWWKLPTEANNQWHAILSNASPVTSYTVPGGTFSAGEIQWLTRAYNVDGTAGPFSTPGYGYYSFICVAAPDPVEGLSATAVPLTTISWQSDEQQAYMITIDGMIAKKAFGNDVASWQVEEPLAEGVHEITVSVQGQYGFWSEPVTISIAVGGPTDELDLTGEFGVDAVLTTDSTGTIRYYRDGVFIGTATDDAPFTDNRALGTHEYFSRILLNDGNYKQSNTVTGEMSVTTKMIAALDGSSGWLELKLSENSMDVDEYRLQQDQVLQHIKGAVWPRGDRSSFRDKYATYNCAFVTNEEAKAFEGLLGKLVILKGRDEEVVIGLLSQVQKRINVFYSSYTFTIQQVHVSEIIT